MWPESIFSLIFSKQSDRLKLSLVKYRPAPEFITQISLLSSLISPLIIPKKIFFDCIRSHEQKY